MAHFLVSCTRTHFHYEMSDQTSDERLDVQAKYAEMHAAYLDIQRAKQAGLVELDKWYTQRVKDFVVGADRMPLADYTRTKKLNQFDIIALMAGNQVRKNKQTHRAALAREDCLYVTPREYTVAYDMLEFCVMRDE